MSKSTTQRLCDTEATTGILDYLADSVKSSLYRNGEVYTRRDRDGSDHGSEGAVMSEQCVTISNARDDAHNCHFTIDANGFELLTQPLSNPDLNFYDHQQVVNFYYPECAEIIRQASGANTVFAFDHNIRSVAGKKTNLRIAGGQQVQAPIHTVHGDYTLTSASQRLRDLTQPPGVNDTLGSILGDKESLLDPKLVEHILSNNIRFGFLNLWRNIAFEPVGADPLALCDGQTVSPKELVVFEVRYHDRIGENYFAKFSTNHQWYYYPEVIRDEAILIKQWDSYGGLARSNGLRADSDGENKCCTFSYHSSFTDPATPDNAPDRQSIEVRCVVLYS